MTTDRAASRRAQRPAAPALPLDSVVVGWDGSAAAGRAVDWAVERLGDRGDLQLLHARPSGAGGTGSTPLEESVARLRRGRPMLRVGGSVVVGDPFDVLVRAAGDGVLLVVGTQPAAHPRPSLVRSFAVRVATAAVGPVAVVPDTADRRRGDRVVVGVDGSAASIDAALAAAVEAERRAQPLVIVHAWWLKIGWDLLRPLEDHAVDRVEEAHRALLDDCADVVARRHPALELVRLLVHGPTDDALVESCRFASVVVLGRHPGGMALPVLLGSTTRDVLQRRAVPTIVVGPTRQPDWLEQEDD